MSLPFAIGLNSHDGEWLSSNLWANAAQVAVRLGGSWVRTDFAWAQYNSSYPYLGNLAGGAQVAAFANTIRAAGLNLLVAITGPLTDSTDVTNFITAATAYVQGAKNNGVTGLHWEILNEPDIAANGPPTVLPQYYVQALEGAYTAMKAVDSTCVIHAFTVSAVNGSGSTGWDFVESCFKTYGLTSASYDIVSYHGYPEGWDTATGYPVVVNNVIQSNWIDSCLPAACYNGVADGGGYTNYVENFQAAVNSWSGVTNTFWITETGYQNSNDATYGGSGQMTPTLQSENTVLLLEAIAAATSPPAVVILYAEGNSGGQWYGVIGPEEQNNTPVSGSSEDYPVVSAVAGLVGSGSGAPTITSVSPSTGPITGATAVTLGGTNLLGATSVLFGTTAATSFNIVSATEITAVAPAHAAGVVDITVVTTVGTSATSSADHFTYGTSAPTVTGVSPNNGTTVGGTSVALTGTNLSGATAVYFGSTLATSFVVNSSTSISAVSPAGAAGSVNVTVVTAGGTSATSSSDLFTYGAPVPVVTSVSPGSGSTLGGTTVTITGSNLSGATAVDFGGTPAESFNVNAGSSDVTFGSIVHSSGYVTGSSSEAMTLALTGVTSGQPIIIFLYGVYSSFPTPTFSDNFGTEYTYTQVDAATTSTNTVDTRVFIATGGAGTSGTITINSQDPGGYWAAAAIPCIGASTASGLSAVDQHGHLSTGDGATLSLPALTPSTNGDGAAYSVGTDNSSTINSFPSSPWTNETVTGLANQVGVAVYSNPPSGTGLTTTYGSSGANNYASVAILVLPGSSGSPSITAVTPAHAQGNFDTTVTSSYGTSATTGSDLFNFIAPQSLPNRFFLIAGHRYRWDVSALATVSLAQTGTSGPIYVSQTGSASLSGVAATSGLLLFIANWSNAEGFENGSGPTTVTDGANAYTWQHLAGTSPPGYPSCGVDVWWGTPTPGASGAGGAVTVTPGGTGWNEAVLSEIKNFNAAYTPVVQVNNWAGNTSGGAPTSTNWTSGTTSSYSRTPTVNPALFVACGVAGSSGAAVTANPGSPWTTQAALLNNSSVAAGSVSSYLDTTEAAAQAQWTSPQTMVTAIVEIH